VSGPATAPAAATAEAPDDLLADPQVIERGLCQYAPTFEAMRDFTATRDAGTRDQIWLLEHPPVFTMGLAARRAHLPPPDSPVPVEWIDRGGQITYHGPGQVVMYVLIDLARRGLTVHRLVHLLEQAAIDLLADHGIEAARREGAPGVYVQGAKIAALGLKVRRGASYHGLSLNVCMDLAPFATIDPCGYPGLAVTQMADLGVSDSPDTVARALAARFIPLIRPRR
jgi:lipoyl(octanoyl) transferase